MRSFIPNLFTKPFENREKIILFKRVFYIFLILNTISILPIVNDLFSVNGLTGTRGFSWIGTPSLLNLLSHPICYKFNWIPWLFIFGQIISLTLNLFNKWTTITGILAYFFTINLFLKAGLFFTGGEILIALLLFYLIFIDTKKEVSFIQNVLNNTFYYAMIIQVFVLYFFSTYFKLFDPNWTNGMALTYISEIEFYSSGWFKSFVNISPSLAKIATISVLIYQAIFPIAVWFKKIKIPYLMYGVLLHLGIAFGMGIFSFGITMIITYILFLEKKHIDYFSKKMRIK